MEEQMSTLRTNTSMQSLRKDRNGWPVSRIAVGAVPDETMVGCPLMAAFVGLGQLATDPEHTRKGAGRMLVEYGTDLTDQTENVPCYLETSAKGRPLSRSKGFEEVGTVVLNLAKWGGEENLHH